MSHAFSAFSQSGTPARISAINQANQLTADQKTANDDQANALQDTLKRQTDNLMRLFGAKALTRSGTAS